MHDVARGTTGIALTVPTTAMTAKAYSCAVIYAASSAPACGSAPSSRGGGGSTL